MTDTADRADWTAWQGSWDRQQEWYMPDREERFRAMLDAVEATAGREPVVLDLACGTGTITDRLLRRLPEATATGVDLDPALLTIAEGHFADDRRVRFVTADLTEPQWTDALPHRGYDAVVTATALHWLDADQLRVLYAQLPGLLRDGGVFLNADHMRDESAPRLNAALDAFDEQRKERARSAGAQDWAAWWSAVAEDPALADAAHRRFALFDDPRVPSTRRARAHRPTATSWHLDALRDAGFSEARQLWCGARDALVAAVR
ncbi:class I SAM-dependent methyltransferase [Streptomyces sulphureus]|uniref:class I SAM-dependent methyltransferase n=1 Tax=Streptomyces sulphureus TaxID=47758 RepID=UPI00037C545B|nr:class I SAM-dependent methyltransferase [Streptomyces sulphureus]